MGETETNTLSAGTSPETRQTMMQDWLNSFITRRLPLYTLFAVIIIVNHTSWWKTTSTGTPSEQQIVTAIGAVASKWAYRKIGIALAATEAIQASHGEIILKTSAPWVDKGIGFLVPVFCVVLSAVYKFGITTEEVVEPWSGMVLTRLIDTTLDWRSFVWKGCERPQGFCKDENYHERYRAKSVRYLDPNIDYVMDGVYSGRKISDTAFRLVVGDVPAVFPDFRYSIKGAIRYRQFHMSSEMDCGKPASEPWTLPCGSNDNMMIENTFGSITTCAPFGSGGRIVGVFTFTSAVNLSCFFTVNATTRRVEATTRLLRWTVKELAQPDIIPVSERAMQSNQYGLALNMLADHRGNNACLFDGNICRNVTPQFEVAVAASLLKQIVQQVFRFTHWGDPFVLGYLLAPIDGRTLKKKYVVIQYWVLVFTVLPILTNCGGIVGGILWTLRRADPEVVRLLVGMRLSHLIDYANLLTVVPAMEGRPEVIGVKGKNDGDVGGVQEEMTKRASRPASRLSFLQWDAEDMRKIKEKDGDGLGA
ncbi:hypothetical protein BC829DRAFT_400637 [Chytridium lagenaria]|nr:hypothetical protein BC829DRAFT_400637 [Chytridium lagenaria]